MRGGRISNSASLTTKHGILILSGWQTELYFARTISPFSLPLALQTEGWNFSSSSVQAKEKVKSDRIQPSDYCKRWRRPKCRYKITKKYKKNTKHKICTHPKKVGVSATLKGELRGVCVSQQAQSGGEQKIQEITKFQHRKTSDRRYGSHKGSS